MNKIIRISVVLLTVLFASSCSGFLEERRGTSYDKDSMIGRQLKKVINKAAVVICC